MRIKMDLEEFDFVIEYIKGQDNVVADALSRISIKDLFEIYEENHVFKINIEPQTHPNKTKHVRIRDTNQVLAFTRSMARSKNTIQNNPTDLDETQRSENKQHISENKQTIFESF